MESRLTFRSKQTAKAWQRQIREQKEKEYKGYKFWLDIDLSLRNAVVKKIDRVTAEKIILEYEWLGDMAITNRYYGIFFDNFCGGAICINKNGVCPRNGREFGLEDKFVSYFARGACAFWTPIGTASKLLSFALKFEKKQGAKMAIAFADTDAGEYGTVYQATNWLCLGRQEKTSYQYVKGNKVVDSRSILQRATHYRCTIAQYERLLEKNGWKRQRTNAKYRYIYILADEPERSAIYEKVKGKIQGQDSGVSETRCGNSLIAKRLTARKLMGVQIPPSRSRTDKKWQRMTKVKKLS